MANPNRTLVFVLLVTMLFVMVNFDQRIGLSYFAIFIGAVVLMQLDKKLSIDIDFKSSNLLQDSLIGVVGYAFFLGLAFGLVNLLQAAAQAFGLLSIIDTGLFSQIAPAFAGNNVLAFVSFGILAPIVENFFFYGAYMEFLADKFKVPLSLRDARSYGLYAVVAFTFTVFHFTARGVPSGATQLINDPALIVTFVFGFVTAILVAFSKEEKGRRDLRPSIVMHMIANTTAILKRFGLF